MKYTTDHAANSYSRRHLEASLGNMCDEDSFTFDVSSGKRLLSSDKLSLACLKCRHSGYLILLAPCMHSYARSVC